MLSAQETGTVFSMRLRSEDAQRWSSIRGADPNAQDNFNSTPLKGSDRLTNWFNYWLNIEAKTKEGHTVLHVAAAVAFVKIVKTLFKAGADVNTCDHKQKTPLMSAARSNRYWMVELLLTMGADVHARDRMVRPR